MPTVFIRQLSAEEKLKVSNIYDTSPATLKDFQVVIMTEIAIRGKSEKYKEDVANLRNWVKAGGGVMAVHDAVGYRLHTEPLFPEIAKGVHNDYLNRDPFFAELCIVQENPAIPGFKQGDRIPLSFYDYVTLIPGSDGKILARGVDKSCDKAKSAGPVIVYGQVGKGRYIACGTLPGYMAPRTIAPPTGAEKQLLMGCIDYLAGKTKSPEDETTELGGGLYSR